MSHASCKNSYETMLLHGSSLLRCRRTTANVTDQRPQRILSVPPLFKWFFAAFCRLSAVKCGCNWSFQVYRNSLLYFSRNDSL